MNETRVAIIEIQIAKLPILIGSLVKEALQQGPRALILTIQLEHSMVGSLNLLFSALRLL